MVNCWEVKKCGRQPGGAKAQELGICPAALEKRANGLNHGVNGGRVCWWVTGTLCGGVVQGTFAGKLASCLKCEFYQAVGKEEGLEAAKGRDVLVLLK